MMLSNNIFNLEHETIIRLLLSPKIGTRSAFLLLQAVKENLHLYSVLDIFTNPKTLNVNLTSAQIASLLKIPENFETYINHHKSWLNIDSSNHHFIPIWHEYYPNNLLDLYDPPIALYVKSSVKNLAKLKHINIAMVGSRQATPNGLQTAFNFASELAKNGFCIVSGLADGIDTSCHKGALMHEASTIAVIGTGIDIIYPQKNLNLTQEISQKGCIISEFILGTQPKPSNFPRRNRLIAALCKGLIVVEASLKSGSLITARLANEIGRDIFAIPSSIYSSSSKGCHALIKQGANLLDSYEDILIEWGQSKFLNSSSNFINNKANNVNVKFEEEKIYNQPANNFVQVLENKNLDNLSIIHCDILKAMGYELINIDTLCERLKLSNSQLQAELFLLELEQYITRLAGGMYQRLI